MKKAETKNNSILTKESHLPKFKTIGDELIVFSIRLTVENVEKESVCLQNLVKNHSEKEQFILNPKLYESDDLKLEFSNKNAKIDMRMPKLVFDTVDHNSEDNPWIQLRNSIKEMLNIDISNAKVEKLNFMLPESAIVKKLFEYKFGIDGFSLKQASQRYRKFIRNDKELEYIIMSSYTHSKNIINEEIILKKNHTFLKSCPYSDFMNSNVEDKMREITFECRKNLKTKD
ncbi:hypothetical protein [Flavobacterium sp. ABG]|uniref:hypothetical protein n=1 Tax=Flavobacterium sp. ABG TaxID=1423322 RepID=UPI000649C62B|nr:hypothetical protein [Flavobacterium sp. ABG]KLT69609.1 hypothetical protein AB674_11745 [Flavobacterium sp. ABG]